VFGRLTEVQVVAWVGIHKQNDNVALAREEVPLEQGNVEVATLEIAGNFYLIPPLTATFGRDTGNWNCPR